MNDYLVNVFTICDKNFSLEQRSDGMIRYFAVIANQWTREESIKSMITSGIKYYGYEESSENINKLIRSLIDTLNKEIRFHYVRSTKCFCDLLEFELTRRNVSLQEMSYVDFGLPNYLELGMYQKGTIQLHNLGLSRTTAIEVNRYCRSKDVPPNEIVGWVRKRAREIQVARPCKIELLRFFS